MRLSCNLEDTVYLKLTAHGEKILEERLIESGTPFTQMYKQKEGYSSDKWRAFILRDLMYLLGPAMREEFPLILVGGKFHSEGPRPALRATDPAPPST